MLAVMSYRHDASCADAFAELAREARSTARADFANGVTFREGIEAMKAAGATDLELGEYTQERLVAGLAQIAAASGIRLIALDWDDAEEPVN